MSGHDGTTFIFHIYIKVKSLFSPVSKMMKLEFVHGISGGLGDPESRKNLQIAEDLNENIKYFLHKSIQTN